MNADIDFLRNLTFYMGVPFMQPDSVVVDIGSGEGDAIAPFIRASEDDIFFQLVDTDYSALREARNRFDGDMRCMYTDADLRGSYPVTNASLTLCVDVLQHIPISERPRLLRSAYHATLPGGALLLVERVVSPGFLEELFTSNNAGALLRTGQLQEAQADGIPLTATMNEQMLKDAGFRIVECFYRHLNYAGWVALKDE